jgi:tRNA-splicing ligase RtcB (3'-phosphate/5'-hydroxy nucleic acid ligase)
MPFTMIDGVPVWGEPQDNAVRQIVTCARDAEHAALMADHHLGYAVPIGGVIAWEGRVSPSGVGYDIACGNKAVRTDMDAGDLRRHIRRIMDDVWGTLSFGVGRRNSEAVDHELFHDDPAWDVPVARALRDLARSQLGTIGSGNHYVDLFTDDDDRVWIGVHFGSRGLGHKLATHFIREGGGKDGIHVDPVLFRTDSRLGREYLACMAGTPTPGATGCATGSRDSSAPGSSRRCTTITTSRGSRSIVAGRSGSCARARRRPSPASAGSSAARWVTCR